MPATRIRRARRDDLPALLALEALFPSDRMSQRSLRHFVDAPNAEFLVVEADGKILGNLLLLTRRGSRKARIYSVIVAPAARGLGLAQQLVRAAEAAAERRGMTQLLLEVRTDNTAARGLYERLDYRRIEALPGYYDDGSDGLRLARRIDAKG